MFLELSILLDNMDEIVHVLLIIGLASSLNYQRMRLGFECFSLIVCIMKSMDLITGEI